MLSHFVVAWMELNCSLPLPQTSPSNTSHSMNRTRNHCTVINIKRHLPFKDLVIFFKYGPTQGCFCLFSVFSSNGYNFYNKSMQKMSVHPVYGAGIRTLNLDLVMTWVVLFLKTLCWHVFFEKNCIKNVHFSILSFHLFYNFKLFFDLTFKLITKFCWVIESYNWLPICETKNASNRPTSMIRLNWRNHLLLKWPSTLEKAFFSWAASASSASSMSAPEMERKPLLRKERRLQRRDSYEGSAIAFKDFLQNKFRAANFF